MAINLLDWFFPPKVAAGCRAKPFHASFVTSMWTQYLTGSDPHFALGLRRPGWTNGSPRCALVTTARTGGHASIFGRHSFSQDAASWRTGPAIWRLSDRTLTVLRQN